MNAGIVSCTCDRSRARARVCVCKRERESASTATKVLSGPPRSMLPVWAPPRRSTIRRSREDPEESCQSIKPTTSASGPVSRLDLQMTSNHMTVAKAIMLYKIIKSLVDPHSQEDTLQVQPNLRLSREQRPEGHLALLFPLCHSHLKCTLFQCPELPTAG